MKDGNPSLKSLKWVPLGHILSFVCLSIGIGAVGLLYQVNEESQFRESARKELSTISNLKVSQVSKWYSSHLDHVEYFYSSPLLANCLKAYMQNPSDIELRSKIVRVLLSRQQRFHYSRVLLFDDEQNLVCSVPDENEWVGNIAKRFISETMRNGKVMVSDLHVSAVVKDYVNMDFFVPVFSDISDCGSKPEGVLMMEVDPREFIFPLIQSWPTVSMTAETLLVRQESNEVVFLNDLRHQKIKALQLRIPMKGHEQVPAVMAVMGREGIVEGLDYRGVPVLSYVNRIPATPWFLVTKMDIDEIYAPLRKQELTTLILVIALILATALGVGFLWKRRYAKLLNISREELEQHVAERTKELADANRELETFSYSVSHDLKSPLRAIDGFATLLEQDYSNKLDDEGKRLLRVIRSGAMAMSQLINDLLEFSMLNRKPLVKTNIDMNKLVRDIWAGFEGDLKGRNISIDIDDLPEISGDMAMIREVVVNLLGNSLKFTSHKKDAVIKVGAVGEKNEIVFSVRDDGVGFDMTYKDKLFAVFQRLHGKDEFEGTGIGLALVQRIIHRHGGRVWAESKVGEGAVFYFSLPGKKDNL